MMTAIEILASAFTAAATCIHFYICYLELPAFGTPKFQETFKTKEADHPVLRGPFNNLGAYNGAIAMITLIGLVAFLAIPSSYGFWAGWAAGLMTCGLALMLCAGSYLFVTSHYKRRAACIQALPPLLALLLWAVCALL